MLTDADRASNYRTLRELHPANRFRLMFGQPLLPQDGYNPNTMKYKNPNEELANKIVVSLFRAEVIGAANSPRATEVVFDTLEHKAAKIFVIDEALNCYLVALTEENSALLEEAEHEALLSADGVETPALEAWQQVCLPGQLIQPTQALDAQSFEIAIVAPIDFSRIHIN